MWPKVWGASNLFAGQASIAEINSLCFSEHSRQVEEEMVPEEASNPGSDQPEAPAALQPRPTNRRPRRGRRGRGRRRPQQQPVPEATEARAGELEERAEEEIPPQEQEVAEGPEEAGERRPEPTTSRSDHGESKPT